MLSEVGRTQCHELVRADERVDRFLRLEIFPSCERDEDPQEIRDKRQIACSPWSL